MTDKNPVSTTETPPDDEPMNVVTEENIAPPGAPQSDQAAPSKDEPNAGKSAEPKDPPEGGDPPPKRTRKRSSERKIAALQRRVTEVEETGQAKDQEITRLNAELAKAQSGPPPAKLTKPKLQDFKTAEEFGDAHAAWLDQEKAPGDKPPVADPPAPKADATTGTPTPEVEEFADKGEAIYGEEFEEVLFDKTLPLSENMFDFVSESDQGPALLMWIDEHREEAREMFHMRPRKLARALEEVVSKFSPDDPPPDPAPDPNRGSDGKFQAKGDPKAPPGEPVRGGGPSSDSGEIKEGLSMDDYARRRRAQQNAHRVR